MCGNQFFCASVIMCGGSSPFAERFDCIKQVFAHGDNGLITHAEVLAAAVEYRSSHTLRRAGIVV